MNTKTKEEIIKKYFKSWLKKDLNLMKNVMNDKIIYSECYGPEYRGIGQVISWFMDWNKCGTVLKWDIKQFIHQKNMTVVEWFFECDYESAIDGFNGVSIIEFDIDGKISGVKEFQSKAEHNFPYEQA